MFYVINGYFLLDVFEGGRRAAWFRRIAGLYAFWMAIYASEWLFKHWGHRSLAELAATAFFGHHHLWYVVGLFGGAALLLAVRTCGRAVMAGLALLLFLAGVAIQYAASYHLASGFAGRVFDETWSHRNFLFVAYPFLCAGYLIRTQALPGRCSRRRATIVAAVGLVALLLEAYANFRASGGEGSFDNYLALGIACPALFLAVLPLRATFDGPRLAALAAAIYFVHPYFIETLHRVLHLQATALTLAAFLASALVGSMLVPLSRRVRFIL